MNLLLTNDDGIDAPGLGVLYRAAEGLGNLLVIAPAEPQSGMSHRVTTHAPLTMIKTSPGWYSIDGTPADCVRIALHHWPGGIDRVLSGVNEGGNLGHDIYLSGTVAAVREGVLHGIAGIAVSHRRRGRLPFRWADSERWARAVIEDLLREPIGEGEFWNVNLPHLDDGAADPEVVRCEPDPSPLPLSFRKSSQTYEYDGVYESRSRRKGTDVDVCFDGRIAVSKLHLF